MPKTSYPTPEPYPEGNRMSLCPDAEGIRYMSRMSLAGLADELYGEEETEPGTWTRWLYMGLAVAAFVVCLFAF